MWFSWDLELLSIPTVRPHHSIYVVVTRNFDVFMILFNINSIEICNKTKISKGFIWFSGELNRIPYLIIDILGENIIRTGKCKSSTCLIK